MTNRTMRVENASQYVINTWQDLRNIDVQQTLTTTTNKAPKGLVFLETKETDTYTMHHTIEDGIERITYLPKNERFQTPILMQHGMHHGAWCWQHFGIILRCQVRNGQKCRPRFDVGTQLPSDS